MSSRNEVEDTKEVFEIRKSKIDRQYNDQQKKDKQLSTKHSNRVLVFVLLVCISCLILKSTYLIDITKDKLDKNVK